MKKTAYLILLPAALLIVLGGLNVFKKATWTEPFDGVIWDNRPEGLTAIRVEEDSPAYLAGIEKGDVLFKINDNPVNHKIDVVKNLWIAEGQNQIVKYEISKKGMLVFPSLNYISRKGTNILYFFLVLIGLAALVIALILFFNLKRSLSLPYLFYFLISLSFFSFFIFSSTGQLDTLDSVFYWLDKISFLVFPPLLLHFFLLFPKRKKLIKKKLSKIYFLYIPCIILLLAKGFIHLPNFLKLDDIFIIKFYNTTEKLDLIQLALFSFFTFGLLLYDTLKTPSPIIKKQLKWIVYGLGLGMIPFSLVYGIPFFFNQIPSKAAELSTILLALVPLVFAYAISKYRLMDIELLLKKAVPLIFSYVVITILLFIVSSYTKIFPAKRINVLLVVLLAIILIATLFTPLKKLFQSLFDYAIHKRTYKYRKTLLSISAELSRERNLQNLSQSLLEMIANALSLKYIALLLPVDNRKNTFFILRSKGNLPTTSTHLTFGDRLFEYLKKNEFLSVFSFAERKDFPLRLNELNSFGFFHVMPLKVEEKVIGCLGMGKKMDDTYLTSEDWELLRTISSPMALALENAYLYNQANIRAQELERLKDYSENIIESLTVGVAVLDQKGKIIGWNRVLEDSFSKKKEEILEKNLEEVLGEKNFSALFPPDTQQEFRLLSEITLELPSGEAKIFDIAKTPLLDNNMKPYGTVIAFEDVTEKFSLQQQLLTSEKLASIGLLSAGVAHEINTPLTGISSYVQILQKKLSNSRHSQILDKIEAQTERVGRIIKNLLHFARNPAESSFYYVDLKESLQGIISLIDYKLKNLNITLELNLSPIQAVWAQGERLQQVYINIILNAIDAMPNGGTLKIDLSRIGNQAVVKIKDTGTGMKSQHLPHIFDPFFTTKGIGKGTGLGLSISYAIIKEHEGYVTVDSQSGKGSLFTVAVPMDLDKRKIKNSAVIQK
jgi:PAS domain S-box-containing protein